MDKAKIKAWIDEELPERFIVTTSEELAEKFAQCFSDIGPKWVSVEDELPQVNQLSRWVRESNSVLVQDDNGSQCVAFYTNEFDGTDGGWVLPTQKFAKIGSHPDFNISQNIVLWMPIPTSDDK